MPFEPATTIVDLMLRGELIEMQPEHEIGLGSRRCGEIPRAAIERDRSAVMEAVFDISEVAIRDSWLHIF